MRPRNLPLLIAAALTIFGCTSSIADDLSAATGPITLATCRTDADCDRGAGCLSLDSVNVCAYNRCDSSRECPDGAVCRLNHCLAVDSDDGSREEDTVRDDGAVAPPESGPSCPRGSIEGYILCAPGFEHAVLSRDPHCETCEPTSGTAERCRAAGLSIEECRALVGGGGSVFNVYERCRNAGYTALQCDRIIDSGADDVTDIAVRCRLAGLDFAECREVVTGDDGDSLAARCRDAGFSFEECRRLTHDEDDDGWSVADRCRAAEIPFDRCRELVADDDGTTADRCLAAGYTAEQCRRLLSADEPSRDVDSTDDASGVDVRR